MLKQNPLRTKSQLKKLFLKMIEIKKRCDEYNIEYRLGGGSLLGICRSGELLPWATGATFHFKESEIFKVKKVFHEFNFLSSYGNKKGQLKFKCFIFELVFWYEDNEFYKRKKYRLPSELFHGEYFINFKNEKFKTFNTAEKYLEFRYGHDWRMPINSNVRSEYKENPEYYTK